MRAEPDPEPRPLLAGGVDISLQLAQPAPGSAKSLFAGHGWRRVDREEFERRSAHAPPAALAQDSSWAWSAFRDLIPLTCALLACWLAFKGPTRALKITLAVLVVVWALPFAVAVGASEALKLFFIPVAMGIGAMAVSTRLVRYHVKRRLLPVGEDACRSRPWTTRESSDAS